MFPCVNVVVAPLVICTLMCTAIQGEVFSSLTCSFSEEYGYYLSPFPCRCALFPALGAAVFARSFDVNRQVQKKTALVCSCRQYYVLLVICCYCLVMLYLAPNRPIIPGSPRKLLNSWRRRLGIRVLRVAHRFMTHDGVWVHAHILGICGCFFFLIQLMEFI